LKFEYDYFGYI
jgi:hypothetical protein